MGPSEAVPTLVQIVDVRGCERDDSILMSGWEHVKYSKGEVFLATTHPTHNHFIKAVNGNYFRKDYLRAVTGWP